MQGTPERFDCAGLDLASPVDNIKPSKFPYLQNVRVNTRSQIESRLGMNDLGLVITGQSPVHSIRRLNDPAAGTYTYIIGTGTRLAYGLLGGAYTDLDGGYSGDPLALMPYRPESATAAWMYVADRSRMRKVSRAGLLQTIGLAPPTAPPTAALANTPLIAVVSDFDAAADWTQGGDAAAPSNQVRVDTTVAQIVYDSGTTGWATVSPASFAGIGPGTRLVFDTGGADEEFITVEECHPVGVATTVAAVIYDSGSTGLCSVVLTAPYVQAELNGLLRRTTATAENVRILAVTEGPDGNIALRVSTTQTWAVGNDVQVLASFRCYLAFVQAAGEDIDSADVVANPGTGFVRTAITYSTGIATLTDTIALDLSAFSNGSAIRPDDIMHISMRVDRPDRVVELKAQLDVDLSTNDFTRNFYTKSFRANDLTPSARNLQSLVATRQTVIQREIIDESLTPADNSDLLDMQAGVEETVIQAPPPPTIADATSLQMGLGDTQWVELSFPISELTKVGTDLSRTLQNVAAIRIVAIIIQSTDNPDVTLDIDSWHIRGGYGPDIAAVGSPYLYRYRARVLGTNVPSNFSPALRGGITARRQSVTVTPTQYAAPAGTNLTAATDIVLDIERFGGNLPEWHYLGTTANGASPSFTDNLPDDTLSTRPTLGNRSFQPWPTIQAPASGTTAAAGVSGTTINDTGTNFNVSWAPGTLIKINGAVYTIYRVISTSRLEIVENAGSQGAVAWQIDEPVLLGQSLPTLWGDEEFGAVFACGDTVNPGRLYISNPFDPDTTVERLYLDITSTSEPLMNGLIWNGRSYVYSNERCFQVLPTGNAAIPYRAEEVPGTGGIWSRWGLSRNPASPFMSALSKHGVLANTGGIAKSLTDDDLFPLFPFEGNLGALTNTISPPNMVSAQITQMRLEYYQGYLYFDYLAVSAVRRTLIFDPRIGGWLFDIYTPTAQCHYGGEGDGVNELIIGGSDGRLYQYAGNVDVSTDVACVVETPSRDQGAPRLNKYYEDCMLDLNPNSVTVSVIPGTNNRATTYTTVTSASASRTQLTVPLSTAAQTARNISLRITWSVSGASKPVLFLWEPRWAPETAPLAARRWSVQARHFGMPNYKHIGTCKIVHVSSADLTFTVTIDGTAQTAITITNSSSAYAESYFRIPVMKGRLMAFDLTSTADFRLAPDESWLELGEWDRGEQRYQRVPVFSQS